MPDINGMKCRRLLDSSPGRSEAAEQGLSHDKFPLGDEHRRKLDRDSLVRETSA
jgi:hypothetical protein